MTSKLIDYMKPGKVARKTSPNSQTNLLSIEDEVTANLRAMPMPPVQDFAMREAYKGPLDYPAIAAWLKACEENFERGCDKHEYTSLSPLFAANGCTRIDDIVRMSPEMIKSLAEVRGIVTTIGLVNRVHAYAVEDVARVRSTGKLAI